MLSEKVVFLQSIAGGKNYSVNRKNSGPFCVGTAGRIKNTLEVVKMKMIIKQMEKRGYYYDTLESRRGHYRFIYSNMIFPLVFESLNDIRQWLAEVV